MASAYAYADGGHERPIELGLLALVDRFGVQAVLNRPYLGAEEMRRMILAENIVAWYRDREKAKICR